MVRLTDLKRRIGQLSKTKPRLHHSYFDLNDLDRKNTVFDKLKRRFSHSDKDISKLVPFDISGDVGRVEKDGALVVFNVMSSLREDESPHADSNNSDVCQREFLKSKPTRRHSTTLGGIPDFFDIVQSNVLDPKLNKMLEKGSEVGCMKDRDLRNVDGRIMTNGEEGGRAYGECPDSVTYGERNEKFGFNTGKSEKFAVKRTSQQSFVSDHVDSDDRGDLFDCSRAEIPSKEEEPSKVVTDLSQSYTSNGSDLVVKDDIEVRYEDVKDSSSKQKYEPTHRLDRMDLECTNAELRECEGNKIETVKSEAELLSKISSLKCKALNTESEHSFKGMENTATFSVRPTENFVSEQKNSAGSSRDGSVCRISRADFNTNRSFPMDSSVNIGQNSSVDERLKLGNYGYYHMGFADKSGADVCCDLCRCALDPRSKDKSCCKHILQSMVDNTATENLAIHAGEECDKYCKDSYDMETPMRNQTPLGRIGMGESRERSYSDESVLLEKQHERMTRTRRLNSAPNWYPMGEEEKVHLEKVYECAQLKKQCNSLKSAMKKRSTHHNGNSLRVRFNLSNSDEDIDKIRSNRGDYLEENHAGSVDVRAKLDHKHSKDEQKKKYKYVMKKFRINPDLLDFDAMRNSDTLKNSRVVENDLDGVRIGRKAKSTGNRETEMKLESVKEFSSLLATNGMLTVANERRHTPVGQTLNETALQTKIRDGHLHKSRNGRSTAGSSVPMLHVAAKAGKIEILKRLVSAGVNLNEKDSEGWPAVHYAIINGHFECAAVLIENGVDVNCYTDDIVKEYCKAIRELQMHKWLLEGKSK